MNTPIRDIAKGEALTGARLSEPYPVIRSVQTITGIGCGVVQIPSGTTIIVPPGDSTQPTIIGKIVANGPASGNSGSAASDYSDARYWVQIEYVNTAGVYDSLSLQDEKSVYGGGGAPQGPVILTATNLGEYNAGTHSLATDGSVYVTCLGFYDKGTPQTLHWLFGGSAAPGVFPVNLTQVGGSNGNKTTAPSWTYSASNAISGNSYSGGPFSPLTMRRAGAFTVATLGIGYLDASGNFQLLRAYEVESTSSCT